MNTVYFISNNGHFNWYCDISSIFALQKQVDGVLKVYELNLPLNCDIDEFANINGIYWKDSELVLSGQLDLPL